MPKIFGLFTQTRKMENRIESLDKKMNEVESTTDKGFDAADA